MYMPSSVRLTFHVPSKVMLHHPPTHTHSLQAAEKQKNGVPKQWQPDQTHDSNAPHQRGPQHFVVSQLVFHSNAVLHSFGKPNHNAASWRGLTRAAAASGGIVGTGFVVDVSTVQPCHCNLMHFPVPSDDDQIVRGSIARFWLHAFIQCILALRDR